jgi:trimethylamine--corrinoid protein Co-methyltransferase
VGYAEARSPLCMDRNMVDIFMEYVRRGFPQTVDTMPSGGATAPMTAAGTLALAAAETLAPLVLAHAIDEDAVVGVDICPSTCDMQSGIFRYSSPERWAMTVARVQLISEFYGCPSGVHGLKTDSCFPDEQAGSEKAASLLAAVLAGAVGVGTCGHLENAVTFSPVQLVIDAEIAAGVRTMLRGIEVSDETLALDLVAEVGPGGNFLETTHTAENFRKVQFNSALMPRLPWEQARARGAGDMSQRAAEKARRLWANQPRAVLDEHQIRDIDKIVAAATKEFHSKGAGP